MAIVGEECGLFPALKDWVQSNKPVRSEASNIWSSISITSGFILQLFLVTEAINTLMLLSSNE